MYKAVVLSCTWKSLISIKKLSKSSFVEVLGEKVQHIQGNTNMRLLRKEAEQGRRYFDTIIRGEEIREMKNKLI